MPIDSLSFHPRLRPARRVYNGLRLARKAGPLAVTIDATNGFFAQVNWALYILAYCHQVKRKPIIRLISPSYSNVPGHDWFHDYFDDVLPHAASHTEPGPKPIRLSHIGETSFATIFSPPMTIESAHRIFHHYYRVKPEIQSYVDNFVASEFPAPAADGAAPPILGLHFRGTDKAPEAPRVPWPNCLKSVMKFAEANPHIKKLFVSSDEPKFIEWITNETRGTFDVVTHPDRERSQDGRPIPSYLNGDNRQKAFEAVVNCFLLTRCAALVRCCSFLSGWASVFNPDLPITMLNRPYGHSNWFPDRENVKRSDSRYL